MRTARYSFLDYKGNEEMMKELHIPHIKNLKYMEETGQNMLAR
jgi:hypothetical protein